MAVSSHETEPLNSIPLFLLQLVSLGPRGSPKWSVLFNTRIRMVQRALTQVFFLLKLASVNRTPDIPKWHCAFIKLKITTKWETHCKMLNSQLNTRKILQSHEDKMKAVPPTLRGGVTDCNYKQNTYREKKLFQGHCSSKNVSKFWPGHTSATHVPSSSRRSSCLTN